MEYNVFDKLKEFFTSLGAGIGNFFKNVWNAFINLLDMFLPRDFATMIAIVILAIAGFSIFLAITKRGD